MTMTDVTTAPKPPSHRPDDLDPDHPLYGFMTNYWFETPKPNGPDWFSYEERCRREAHANAYGQHGDKVKWKRYLNLGFFTFEDCTECDKVWDNMDTDPLMVHRSIWYNFMYHVDNDLKVPKKLNAWATNITHPYLAFYDPTTLRETDTEECTWKEMPFMTAMDEDMEKTNEWIPVQRRRRSKSPPTGIPDTNSNLATEITSAIQEVNTALDINGPPLNNPTTEPTNIAAISSIFRKRKKHKKWSSKPPSVSTVTEEDEVEDGDEDFTKVSPSTTNTVTTEKSNVSAHPSKLPMHTIVPTNDGTHRITIRWTSEGNTKAYDNDKKKLHEDICVLIQDMFQTEGGSLYGWESEDLSVTKPVSTLTTTEFHDFVSPDITIVHSKSKVIFGLRFGFQGSPGNWLRSEYTKTIIQTKQLEVTISNSQSTSGKMVTAGYILLKAPNSTHVNRYTQYLRGLLPDDTPYFDIRKYKKTPMDQLIPHLVIQCGENHVTPLCQALISILTGRRSALFLPRYAFSTLDNEQVRQQFLFHQKWSQSLVPLTLSPHVTHLDQIRVEYDDQGNTLQRSTREWAQSLTATDGVTPALYDVANGLADKQAYFLVPRHLLPQAEAQLRQYKTKLQPPNQREARYRENLPGLPDVIHIRTEIQSNVMFLEQMSSEDVWKNAPAAIRQATSKKSKRGQKPKAHSSTASATNKSNPWPTALESSQSSCSSAPPPTRKKRDATNTHFPDPTVGTADDGSTESTQSLTQGSQTLASNRFQELELMMKEQQKTLDDSGKASTERLLALEKKFIRIDDLDRKLAAVTTNLEQVTTKMEHASLIQHHMSNDVKDMKSNTTQQFGEINQRLISTMENQHQMSATMIDLRSHFEKMSTFMLELASKMEAALQKPADSPPPQYMSSPTAAAPSSQNSSVTSVSSQSLSTDSSHASTVYHSPEMKKRRASTESRITDTHDFSDDISLMDASEQEEDDNKYSKPPRVNLDALFQSHESVSPKSKASQAETPRLSNVRVDSEKRLIQQLNAPLNSQYNTTDSAGALLK